MDHWLILFLCVAFFAVCWAVIAYVFVTMARQGDERRKLIVGRAAAACFPVFLLYLIFHVVEDVYRSVTGGESDGVNAFSTLLVFSVLYAIELLYYKRKYGD
ncbi:hypothetical protein [uncultured Gemmiger sp.]|uniref:hypothetical protein n=1 Tax=uncultured Gemmiger sp. TaxID=1623490 RepID=UPI0025DD935D|nr:hypothetical protein [uncultured Gemmiger sp.]